MSSLRDELLSIHEKHGQLTPELVVQEARKKTHPLHTHVFDRAPAQAAEAWYRHRAHELIQKAQIVVREATETETQLKFRAFVAVRNEGPTTYVYEPIEKVAKNPLLRELALREMEREWRQMLARYEGFQEFLSMVASDLRKRKAA